MATAKPKDTRKGNRHRPGYFTEYMRIWRARQKAKSLYIPKPNLPTPTKQEDTTVSTERLEDYAALLPDDEPYAEEVANMARELISRRSTDGEAVAWLHPSGKWADTDRELIARHCLRGGPHPEPLYTHPTPIEPVAVTDEMLIAIGTLYGNYIPGHGWTGFGPTPEDLTAALQVKP